MKQVLAAGSGKVQLVESPPPSGDCYDVVIATEYSLISSGTERTSLSRSGSPAALARQALTDPTLRAKATQRLRAQGAAATLAEARSRAAKPTALGYSAAGRVVALGELVHDLHIGQRVAASGAEYANHAEIISVPRPLVCPIPDAVTAADAAYVTLGSIAMHGHRLGGAALADTVAVIGLGLVGQLSIRLAAAAGCQVFGTDPILRRCELAAASVAHGSFHPRFDSLSASSAAASADAGVDVVVLTAATSDRRLANQCLRLLRDRGKLVIVGDVPLILERDLMYYKEIEVVVSRSYGPGRYDRGYEERGADYPIGQVRWTQGRNFAAFLSLLERQRIDVSTLTTAVVPITEAPRAYELAARPDEQLGVLLSYPGGAATAAVAPLQPWPSEAKSKQSAANSLTVALVGPGAFATSVLRPAMAKIPELVVAAVVAHKPADARVASARFGAMIGTTELSEVLDNQDIAALIIATRHDTHAEYAVRALEAGKHVLVEKPLGLSVGECEQVVAAASHANRLCMVNFNRRFSPHATAVRKDVGTLSSGVSMVYRVNAGQMRPNHWARDPIAGGGRVIGEAVHFFDFACWMFRGSPSEIVSVGRGVADPLNEVICSLVFPVGRTATIIYMANGSSRVPKEWIEVSGGGHSWTIDDFTTTKRDGRTLLRGRQSKGHLEALRHFVGAAMGRTQLTVTAEDGLRATQIAREAQRLA